MVLCGLQLQHIMHLKREELGPEVKLVATMYTHSQGAAIACAYLADEHMHGRCPMVDAVCMVAPAGNNRSLSSVQKSVLAVAATCAPLLG